MITITRLLARQLRAVFRRALQVTRGCGPDIFCRAGPDGLRIRARTAEAAIEYHASGDLQQQQLTVSSQFLSDCEGAKDDPVQLELEGKSHVVATWRDDGVPQVVSYEIGADGGKNFPVLPAEMSSNNIRLLPALHYQGDCTLSHCPNRTFAR